MKKLICGLMAFSMLVSLCACGNSAPREENHPGDGMSLTEIKDNILADVADLPALMDMDLDEESFPYFAFVPAEEGLTAVVSEAAMSAVAHSVVILRASDSERAQDLAKEIEANADPRKWICVGAEKTIVSVHGSTILLVMSSAATADAIAAKFDSLWK